MGTWGGTSLSNNVGNTVLIIIVVQIGEGEKLVRTLFAVAAVKQVRNPGV